MDYGFVNYRIFSDWAKSNRSAQHKQIRLFWRTIDGKPFDVFSSKNQSVYYWLNQGNINAELIESIVLTIQKSDSIVHAYFLAPRVLEGTFLDTDGTTIIKCVITSETVWNPQYWNCIQHEMPFDISRRGMEWGTNANAIAEEADGKYIYLTGREFTPDSAAHKFTTKSARKFQVMSRIRYLYYSTNFVLE